MFGCQPGYGSSLPNAKNTGGFQAFFSSFFASKQEKVQKIQKGNLISFQVYKHLKAGRNTPHLTMVIKLVACNKEISVHLISLENNKLVKKN